MTAIGEKIKQARKLKGLTQGELAQRCGWSRFPSRISNYERGLREPKSEDLLKLAQALNISVEWLYSQATKQSFTAAEPSVEHYEYVRWIPVISWEEICLPPATRQTTEQFLVSTQSLDEKSYALKVQNDSMMNSSEQSFMPGAYIIVDPERKARNQQFVIAQLSTNSEPTFKQLITDAGKQYLRSLNPLYPLLEMRPESTILGVVCEMVRYVN